MCTHWGVCQPFLLIFDLGQHVIQVVAMACAFSIGIKVFFHNLKIFICSLLMVLIRLLVCYCAVYCQRWVAPHPLLQRLFHWLHSLTGVNILLGTPRSDSQSPTQTIEDITDELRGLVDWHMWSNVLRSYIHRVVSYVKPLLPEVLRPYIGMFGAEGTSDSLTGSTSGEADTGSTVSRQADGDDEESTTASTTPSRVFFDDKAAVLLVDNHHVITHHTIGSPRNEGMMSTEQRVTACRNKLESDNKSD